MPKATSLDIDGMSTEEKIEQIKMMRELIRLKEKAGEGYTSMFKKSGKKKNLISNTVMTVVLVTSFILIVAMAIYSFRTLYLAIQKKFPSPHTELIDDDHSIDT